MSAPVTPTESHHALPVGQRLDEYEIRAVIGVGGFGIVYHAFDHALERDVAIKEYMPGALASRSATLHVSVLSQGHAETFALGLRSFVNEARLLARFDHPALVKVHRFWEGNGTAYMVMPLYRGRTLKAMRQASSESADEAWLRGLVTALLGAVETLHAQDVFHRDIAPDNILVGDDGRPVLLDFGAARRVISDRSQTLTAILKPSYAPIEQYAEATGLRQGAWTDLYALGATLHFVITGQAPQPATARALGTDHHLLASHPRRGVSVEFLRIVDWMMAPRPEHRPQSVAALRDVLDGQASAPVPPAPTAAPATTAWERTVVQPGRTATTAARTQVLPRAPAPTRAPEALAPAAPRPAARHSARRWAMAAAVLLMVGVAGAAWHRAPSQASTVAANGSVAPLPAQTAAAPAPPMAAVTAPPASAPAPAAHPATNPALTPPAVDAQTTAAATPGAVPTVLAKADAAAPSVPAPPATARARKPSPKPAAAPEPAPVAAPAAPDVAAPLPQAAPPTPIAAALVRPRDQCQGRLLLALHRCLKRVCQDPSVTNHRDCQRMRQIEVGSSPGGAY